MSFLFVPSPHPSIPFLFKHCTYNKKHHNNRSILFATRSLAIQQRLFRVRRWMIASVMSPCNTRSTSQTRFQVHRRLDHRLGHRWNHLSVPLRPASVAKEKEAKEMTTAPEREGREKTKERERVAVPAPVPELLSSTNFHSQRFLPGFQVVTIALSTR